VSLGHGRDVHVAAHARTTPTSRRGEHPGWCVHAPDPWAVVRAIARPGPARPTSPDGSAVRWRPAPAASWPRWLAALAAASPDRRFVARRSAGRIVPARLPRVRTGRPPHRFPVAAGCCVASAPADGDATSTESPVPRGTLPSRGTFGALLPHLQ